MKDFINKPSYTTQKDTTVNLFIQSLIDVESSGDDAAIGDNGKAKGCLQIWNIVVEDVNRLYNTNYTHDDVFDREKAVQICVYYLTYWGEFYENAMHCKPTYEILARIWNGGPHGWAKDSTLPYWEKVKQRLHELSPTTNLSEQGVVPASIR